MAQTKKKPADKSTTKVTRKPRTKVTKKNPVRGKSKATSPTPAVDKIDQKELEARNKAIEKAMQEAQDAVAQAEQNTAEQAGH